MRPRFTLFSVAAGMALSTARAELFSAATDAVPAATDAVVAAIAAAVTPETIADAYDGPVDGECRNAVSERSPDRLNRGKLYSNNADAPAACYALCEQYHSTPGYVGYQWREASLRPQCACFFDDETCPESNCVNKFDSVGPVSGNGRNKYYCYSYKNYYPVLRSSIYNGALTSYLNLDSYGSTIQIANAGKPYDQGEDGGGASPSFSPDHASITLSGNTWSAYLLPAPITIGEDTVLQFDFSLKADADAGFQAVCLDADVEESGGNGRCFVVRSTQGKVRQSSQFVNVAKQTEVGETTSHYIPVGDFFTGTIQYVAFLQDSDGEDRAVGRSSFANLRLSNEPDEYLNFDIGGTVEQIQQNKQVSLSENGKNDQDEKQYWLHVTEDHTSVVIDGNQWKALPLNAPYTITPNTILEFDVNIEESSDFNAICLEDKPSVDNGNCVVVQNPRESRFGWYHLVEKVETGVTTTLSIPYGSFMGLKEGETEVANYLALIQDNDVKRTGGVSTWSDFKLYEEVRPAIVFSAFGADVTVTNVQEALENMQGDIQDSRDHLLSVTPDGKSVTATGNTWKFLRLPETLTVTPATMLEFDFAVAEQSEQHAVCFLKEDYVNDGRRDCFFTAGTDRPGSGLGVAAPLYTGEGESNHYETIAGSYFKGDVKYLGFILDNDKSVTSEDYERTYGQSTWSNLVLYNLPTLDIGLDDTTISIENHQVSYDQNQDSRPIRDYMATLNNQSINFKGNVWRALELPAPLSFGALGDFLVTFDFEVIEAAEIHAICFDEDLEYGNQDDTDNPDARRCVATAHFQSRGKIVDHFIADHQTTVGETHRYALNLSKMFQRVYDNKPIRYIAFIQDEDRDFRRAARRGESTYSNIQITTDLASCLGDTAFDFELVDCTVANFFDKIQKKMQEAACPSRDPLIELMAMFDATQETDVYRQIEKICTESYELMQYDFAGDKLVKDLDLERQLVKEYIDGGSVMHYEEEAGSTARIGFVEDKHSASRLLSWPKHHALDDCDIGAAMCCFIGSRDQAEDNSEVCYVDMKASRYTAHVRDGYSIYGEGDAAENLYCEGFAWGNDGGALSSALKGNALFKVGFLENFDEGRVEQVPGAPLCGCVDRMPVVTEAACTDVSAPGSKVKVSYGGGMFSGELTLGAIEYGDCGGAGLVEYYEALVGEGKATEVDADYMKTRVVGEGGCPDAINTFLATKGLVKSSP